MMGRSPFTSLKFREIFLQDVCGFNEYRVQSGYSFAMTECQCPVRLIAHPMFFLRSHPFCQNTFRIKYLMRYRSYQMGDFNVRFALTFDRRLESNAIDISTKCHDYEIPNRNLMASRIHKIYWEHIDGLVQGCRNSSALAMELTRSYAN